MHHAVDHETGHGERCQQEGKHHQQRYLAEMQPAEPGVEDVPGHVSRRHVHIGHEIVEPAGNAETEKQRQPLDDGKGDQQDEREQERPGLRGKK